VFGYNGGMEDMRDKATKDSGAGLATGCVDAVLGLGALCGLMAVGAWLTVQLPVPKSKMPLATAIVLVVSIDAMYIVCRYRETRPGRGNTRKPNWYSPVMCFLIGALASVILIRPGFLIAAFVIPIANGLIGWLLNRVLKTAPQS